MIDRTNVLLRRHVLVVDDSLLRPGTADGRAVHDLVGEFTRRGVAVTTTVSRSTPGRSRATRAESAT
jgi:hypothetical protein